MRLEALEIDSLLFVQQVEVGVAHAPDTGEPHLMIRLTANDQIYTFVFQTDQAENLARFTRSVVDDLPNQQPVKT